MSLFLIYSFESNAQTYEEQWEKYSVEINKMTDYDSLYIALIMKRDSALTGIKAPNFTTKTISNKVIELSKLEGKVVVLNFWYTACQPCIEEMPLLNSLVDYFKGQSIKFISFANEDSAKLKPFLLKHFFKFEHVANSSPIRQGIFKLFSAWPYTIIIDKKGNIAKIKLGGITNKERQEYIHLLKKLIDESK